MDKKEFYYPSSNGKTVIHAVEWTPDDTKDIKGIIQIAHGLNEHITMYEPVARFFTNKKFIVRGEDHVGHGLSVAKGMPPLYFGKKGSWRYLADDLYELRNLTKKEYGDTPYIMLGFSLGSYLIRDYLIRYNETIDAGIIVGCLYNNPVEHFFGTLLSNILAFFMGDTSKSKLLDSIVNGSQNKQIKNSKTPLDWLNENQEEIKRLQNDPYVQGDITIGLFRELMYGVNFTTSKKNIAKMNANVPILFLSGKDDPLAKKGKTIEILKNLYIEAGVKDVHARLYKGRHRVLFEEDSENTLIDIYDWVCSKLNTEHKKIDEIFDDYDKYLEKEFTKEKNIDENEPKEKIEHKEFFLRSVKTNKAILVTVEGNLTSITAPKLFSYCDGLDNELKNIKLIIDLKSTGFIAEPGKEILEKLKNKYKDNLVILEK